MFLCMTTVSQINCPHLSNQHSTAKHFTALVLDCSTLAQLQWTCTWLHLYLTVFALDCIHTWLHLHLMTLALDCTALYLTALTLDFTTPDCSCTWLAFTLDCTHTWLHLTCPWQHLHLMALVLNCTALHLTALAHDMHLTALELDCTWLHLQLMHLHLTALALNNICTLLALDCMRTWLHCTCTWMHCTALAFDSTCLHCSCTWLDSCLTALALDCTTLALDCTSLYFTEHLWFIVFYSLVELCCEGEQEMEGRYTCFRFAKINCYILFICLFIHYLFT